MKLRPIFHRLPDRSGRSRGVVGVLLGLGMAAASACTPGPGGEGGDQGGAENALLIVIDTLRADALGCYGAPAGSSPSLDRFAESALRFDAAYAQATRTHPAMASMLTGLYPPNHGTLTQGARLRPGVLPLSTLLQASGLACGLFAANMCALQEREQTVFSMGWDHQFCGMDLEQEQWTWDRAVADAAQEWIDGQTGPWFALVYLMDPHSEHRPPPADWDYAARPVPNKYEQSLTSSDFEVRGERPDEAYLVELKQLYAAEVLGVDRVAGELIQFVEALPEAERTAVVVVADHGEELFDSWVKSGHGHSLTDWVLQVPLLVRLPGVEPQVVERTVETLQVAPTLLQALGISAPTRFDGPSLLESREGRPRAVSFSGDVGTLTRGQWRVWRRLPTLSRYVSLDSTEKQEQQLAGAPWTQRELMLATKDDFKLSVENSLLLSEGNYMQRARGLSAELFDIADRSSHLEAAPAEADPELLEQLKALGYSEADF
jgi:arylsulfatase A-like enzyme